MYKHLISYLKQDLETFDEEDCKKIRNLLKYLKQNEVPLKLIKESTYDYYEGWCFGKDIIPMTEWQFDLCKAELTW